jgi:hypothetical protein
MRPKKHKTTGLKCFSTTNARQPYLSASKLALPGWAEVVVQLNSLHHRGRKPVENHGTAATTTRPTNSAPR